MKVLVAYYSETQNTEKVAKAIYDEVSKKHQTHLKKVAETTADALNNYDLVFLGSACHSTDLALPVKKLLAAAPKSPRFKLAGFFTHAVHTQEHYSKSFDMWASNCVFSFENTSKEKQIDFRGYYNCQGAPSPEIQEFIRNRIFESANNALARAAWKQYIEEALKHPNHEDLHKAKEFAQQVLSNL